MSEIWAGVIGTIAGVVVGHLLATRQANRTQQARVKANWAAITTQLLMCSQLACKFLEIMTDEDGFFKLPREDKWRDKSPDYRLPNNAYYTAVPALLADAAITNDELKSLSQIFGKVETFNRGLDQAVAIRRADLDGQGWEFGDQLECNCTYAMSLISRDDLKTLPLKTVGTRLPSMLRDNYESTISKPTLFDEAWMACKRHNDTLA